MSKRVSVAERLDAAGISNGHVGSAVEQLLAPNPTGDTNIVQIPVDKIEAHPRNRKIQEADVADIVAGLKAGESILNALGVTAAADWNANRPADLKEIAPGHFIITAGGHRRLLAAELAGLPTVPCVVRADFAGVEGRRAALLENLQRQDLDPFEEAEAFAELVTEYKLSQRDLADRVGCNQSHISKRLKLLKLPSTVRESVRVGQTPVADAVELARVADQGPIFDAAWERFNRNRWSSGKEAVDTAIAAHEQAIAVEKARAACAEQGLRQIDRQPTYYPYSAKEPASLEALKLAADKHAGEPCHVAYVDRGGEVILGCEQPGQHLKTGASKVKVTKSIADRISSRGDAGEAKQRAERRELKKLWPGRAAIARGLVYGRDDLMPAAEAELIARGVVGAGFHGGRADAWKVVCDFAAPLELADYPTHDATDELLRKMPAIVVHRLMALAYFEWRLRSTHLEWGSDGRYYLDLLAQHGYTITSLEKQKLGKATGEVVEADVACCVQCGCTDATPCDGGCAWVAENLCSACSDAIDDGLIGEHEQLLEASEAVG